MIKEKLFKRIILGMAIAIVILLFFTCRSCNKKDPEAPVITAPEKIVHQVEDNERIYKAKFDSLNSINADLAETNSITLDQLQSAQARGRQLAAALRRKLPGDTTIVAGGVDPTVNGSVEEYITNSEHRDTLCNNAIANLQDQVINRNQVITAKDTLYSRLRSSFDFTIAQQESLIKYNKDLQKQIKRKKFGAALWKVTTIAAGLFILKQNL